MREAEKILRKDVEQGIIKGAAVLAGTPDRTIYRGEFGFAENALTCPMKTDTVIDCASVTKAAATVTALLVCHVRGMIDFDAPFTEYLPDYKPVLRQRITVRNLADHTSGFIDPPAAPRSYFDESGRKMLENILNLPPPCPIPAEPRYSCWNYILLSMIAERITGRKFSDFCRTEIFLPLGMNDTSLGRPLPNLPLSRLAQTIRTEAPGQISDFVAYRIYRDGGCAGNAGMFSSCEDLAKLFCCYLRHGKTPDGKALFGESEFREIAPDTARKVHGYRRFGWEIWNSHLFDSAFGTSLSHSGWSGQTVFMDFRKNMYVIVLTIRNDCYEQAKIDRYAVIRDLYENC